MIVSSPWEWSLDPGEIISNLADIEFINYVLLAVIGVIVFLNVVFAAIVATNAEKRNQSWGSYFAVGLIFGFHISLLFILLHDAFNRHWRAEDRHVMDLPEYERDSISPNPEN